MLHPAQVTTVEDSIASPAWLSSIWFAPIFAITRVRYHSPEGTHNGP